MNTKLAKAELNSAKAGVVVKEQAVKAKDNVKFAAQLIKVCAKGFWAGLRT